MLNEVPDQLAAPTFTDLTATGAKVSWLPPERDNGMPVLYYVLTLTFREPAKEHVQLRSNPGVVHVEGYTYRGTGALCSGGSQLMAAGPNWEVANGISACKNQCDGSACEGFVWWEDYGCRTYSVCSGLTPEPASFNHVFSKAPELSYVINTGEAPASNVNSGADGVPRTSYSMHGVQRSTIGGTACYHRETYDTGYQYCMNHESNGVINNVPTADACRHYCSLSGTCTHSMFYPYLSAREKSNMCYIITSCGGLMGYTDEPKHDIPYWLVKSGHECMSTDTGYGVQSSIQNCADIVRSNGGSYFIFGTGSKAGHCFTEWTSTAACSEGWESDEYDFYAITPAEMPPLYDAQTSTKLSSTYCISGDQTLTVPLQCTQVHVSVWGGGGGGGDMNLASGGGAGGGGGGFASGLLTVTPGGTIQIVVGVGGVTGFSQNAVYGGGGAVGSSYGAFAGGGGGRSAIRISNVDQITAGGGGGGGGSHTMPKGGGGGGHAGVATSGGGGSQTGKGTGGTAEGDQHTGSRSTVNHGGGGGGGWYGGGAGSGSNNLGGGGGSNYIGGVASGTMLSGSPGGAQYGGLVGGMDSMYYPVGGDVGRGSQPGGAGSNGHVVLADWGQCPGIGESMLHSSTTYTVSVGAINGVGQAIMSTEASFTTL